MSCQRSISQSRLTSRSKETQGPVICEVAQQLGNDRIRAVALAPTDGIVRGAEVRNTGGPITVPVGDQTLGHIFNVWGDSLDAPDLEFTGERWPIHRDPPAFKDVEPQKKVLETGDQSDRPHQPVPRGWKDRPLWWCWCWQDGADPRDDQPSCNPPPGGVSVFAGVGSAPERATTFSWKCRSPASSRRQRSYLARWMSHQVCVSVWRCLL